MTATPSGGGYKLDGAKSFVLDGHTADLIVVLARLPNTGGEDGLSLFTVRGDAAGLKRQPLKTMDATRKLARLTFDGVEAALLGEAGAAAAPFARTMTQAVVVSRQRDGRWRREAARVGARICARCACSSGGRSPRSSR